MTSPRRKMNPLPQRLERALDRFQWDPGTVEVDWARAGPSHGSCGANAARAALAFDRVFGWRRRLPPWGRGHA